MKKKFLNDIINKTFGNLEIFKFLKFLFSQYKRQNELVYKPEDFALFEQGAIVEFGSVISCPERVFIKEHSIIHKGTLINSSGGLYLGRYSGISYNCTIFTVDHMIINAKSIPFDNRVFIKPVFIDDFVNIGANVCIAPGIRIGEGAVIGMGSVVRNDIHPLSIVAGNPAKPIFFRDKNSFEKLKEEKKFQPPFVDNYEEVIPLMMKNKHKSLIEKIQF